MLLTMLTPLMTALILGVTLVSCVCDVRTLRIPNKHALIVLLAFPVAYAASPAAFGSLWSHLGAMVIMFLITYGMFVTRMIGGGDSKLGTVLGLWVGLQGFMPFMFYMALTGGVVGALSLWISKKKPFSNPRPGSWVAAAQSGKSSIPYGIAITAGAWAGLVYTGFIHNQLDEVLKIIH